MAPTLAQECSAAIHQDTLKALLSLGSAQMGHSLLSQLIADFERIRVQLLSDDSFSVDRAAHELKGLSATMGAHKLADLAQVFDAAASTMGQRARLQYRDQIAAELDAVLSCLFEARQRFGQA